MAALDNLPGIDLLAGWVASFKCPNTHFIYPPIDSFLKTITFDLCGDEKTMLSLPRLNDIPNISWDILKNLVDVFIKTLKTTLTEALMALLAKTAQLFEAALCKWLGDPFNLPSLSMMDLIGREGCTPSEVLKAAGAAPPGTRPDISDEDYENFAQTLSNAGNGLDLINGLLGKGDGAYCRNAALAIKTSAPKFADHLGTPESICEFLTIAGSLMSTEQRSELSNQISPNPALSSLQNKCLVNTEVQEQDENLRNQLTNLPEDVLSDYMNKKQDRANQDVEQTIDLVLNGPLSTLNSILDNALGTGDPDCTDGDPRSAGEVIKKAKETPSFKNVRAGIFNRVQKAFLDDTIDWNAFEPFDSPGIIGQILADSKGYTLNRYNWYRNLKNSNPIFAVLFPEPSPLPLTVGTYMRDQYLAADKSWNEGGVSWVGGENDQIPNIINNPNSSFSGTENIKIKYSVEETGLVASMASSFGFPVPKYETEIKIYNNPDKNSLSYMAKFGSQETDQFAIIAQETVTDSDTALIAELSEHVDNSNEPFRVKIAKAIIKKAWSSFNSHKISTKLSKKMISGANVLFFDKFANTMMDGPDGGLPEGFLYGYTPVEITSDDLTYVDPTPNAQEYTYTEESQVLGRSKTSNPRVQFLDPAQHGGTYQSPFYNILAEEKQGWSQFGKSIVSNLKGCDTPDTNYMFFQDIIDRINDEESKISPDERLSLSPDCVNERPFDKIASASTLATLGGVVTAIVRAHVIDYMIRTYPINSNIDMAAGRNHSKILSKFVVRCMKASLSEQSSMWTSTYERGVYWLLFLEQTVQSVQRKIESGDIEPDDQLLNTMEVLNNAQKTYKVPQLGDLRGAKDIKEYNIATEGTKGVLGSIATGALIASAGLGAPLIALGAGAFSIAFGAFSISQARFTSKIGAIYDVEEECMIVLEYLVEEQMNFYSDVLKETLEPRPYINDVSKYFIGASKTLIKSTPNAGIVEIEQPTGGKSNYPYGDIDGCVETPYGNPLDMVELSEEQLISIKKNGGFFLEKYLRVEDKTAEENFLSSTGTGRPSEAIVDGKFEREWVDNRSKNLKGVVNIDFFKRFLSNNIENIPPEANVSDFFGNAKFKLTEEEYEGSIGIKFGVRLCYIPPEGIEIADNTSLNPFADEESANVGKYNFGGADGVQSAPNLTPADGDAVESGNSPQEQELYGEEISNNRVTDKDRAREEKSFILRADPRISSSKNIFPICQYEMDVLDRKLAYYIDSDKNFNQDIKCYVDGLTETPEFRLLFNHILNIKKVPSMAALYSYMNFYPSLGKGAGERIDGTDEDPSKDVDLSNLFNDTKHELRKLFVSNYKRNDYDPKDEEDKEGGFFNNISRGMLAKSVNNIFIGASVPWWVKWRYKQKKVDEDGEPCGNQFGALVNLTGD